MAGNPYDARRSQQGTGSTFDALKANVQEAVEVCLEATTKVPGELRFRYELARAYQVTDPRKAIPLLKDLMAHRYAAAFDNYGWTLLDSRLGVNDFAGAVVAFRSGVQLGDIDAMHSLASLIIDGRAPAYSFNDAVQLFRRAASQGHLDAQEKLANIEREQAAAEQERMQDEQSRRAFMGVLGGVIQGLPRR